jgi:hypothetical protein
MQINVIPLGVERWKGRVFLSTPRWKKGVPATLSSLPTVVTEESAPLQPYPDWDWHTTSGKKTCMNVIFEIIKNFLIIIISLLMSPLLGRRPSLRITHKENGP